MPNTLPGMRRSPASLLLLVVAAAGLLLTSCAAPEEEAQAETSGIGVQEAWVRATTGTDDPSMTGAFMVIDNPGPEDVTLTGASSPVAKTVELHEMAMVDGKSVMQQVEGGIVVRAGTGKVLMPGGYHVMLMGLTDELAPGDEVELSLEFAGGATETLTVPVKAFTEEEPHYHPSGSAHPSASMSP